MIKTLVSLTKWSVAQVKRRVQLAGELLHTEDAVFNVANTCLLTPFM